MSAVNSAGSGKLSFLFLLGVMALIPDWTAGQFENEFNTSSVVQTKTENLTKYNPKTDVLQVQERLIDTKGIDLFRSDLCPDNHLVYARNCQKYKYRLLILVSAVVGWAYIIAWSVFLFPQIWTNYKLKSVVGLDFDFIAYSIVGNFYYLTFNVAMFWVPFIRAEFLRRYGGNYIPVMFNDVVYAITTSLTNIVLLVQCCVYDKGDQKVSFVTKILMALCGMITLGYIIVCTFEKSHWLEFAYFCSYVKLATTVKYIPQMYLNYKRKSTEGLNSKIFIYDLVGGVLSIIQIFVDAYNYNYWEIFLQNLSKFLLGLMAAIFDMWLLFQHFSLYKPKMGNEKATPVLHGYGSDHL